MSNPNQISPKALKIRTIDNVATVITDIKAGLTVTVILDDKPVAEIKALEHIPTAHKIALRDISCGEEVFKYGDAIGQATADIPTGGHVHIHNIKSQRGSKDIA